MSLTLYASDLRTVRVALLLALSLTSVSAQRSRAIAGDDYLYPLLNDPPLHVQYVGIWLNFSSKIHKSPSALRDVAADRRPDK